jgi:hypothetical protein
LLGLAQHVVMVIEQLVQCDSSQGRDRGHTVLVSQEETTALTLDFVFTTDFTVWRGPILMPMAMNPRIDC